MTKDRLDALKAILSQVKFDYDVIHINMNPEPFMPDFFAQVEEISGNCEQIKKCIYDVKKLHSTLLLAPTNEEKVRDELEERMSEIKQIAQKNRVKIKEMEALNSELEKLGKPNTAEYRICTQQFSYLTHEFTITMGIYNSVQVQYREDCKTRIQRQLEISGKQTNDREIEEMLETGNFQIFSDQYLQETKQARQTLADIKAQHNQIIRLEKNILELHDMFMDMAQLVESQGEMVDNIEKSMLSTGDYVEQAKTDTTKALSNARAARRKKILIICIGVVVLVVAVVILIVVLSQYIPKGTNKN